MMNDNSMFSSLEFSQQPESFLDEMFGLSADVLAADLDTDGSILDLGLDDGLGFTKPQQQLPRQSNHQESLEDLLSQGPTGDSFGEDWMETVDFKTLLNSNATTVPTSSPPIQAAAPVPQAPIVKIEQMDEPRKEGLKAAAFELLKALLTSNQPIKQELSLTVEQLAPLATTPPVHSPIAEVPNIDFSPVTSPVNNVEQKLDFTSTLGDTINFDLLLDEDEPQQEPHYDHLILMPTVETEDIADTSADNDGPLIASIELVDSLSPAPSSQQPKQSSSNFNYGSPVSSEDDYSAASPASPAFSTVDCNQFSDTSSQVSEQDFTQLRTKSRKEKTRPSPYDNDSEYIVTDKKVRKKMQNKNAATRYRVKKRQEKETLQEQEVRLSDRNKELKEKVESLQREIKYMKELMNEINKAKQKKV